MFTALVPLQVVFLKSVKKASGVNRGHTGHTHDTQDIRDIRNTQVNRERRTHGLGDSWSTGRGDIQDRTHWGHTGGQQREGDTRANLLEPPFREFGTQTSKKPAQQCTTMHNNVQASVFREELSIRVQQCHG